MLRTKHRLRTKPASGGGGGSTIALRFVSHANLIGDGNNTSSGTQLGRAMKVVHYIGSGAVTEIRLMLNSWCIGSNSTEGALLPGNSFTVPEMWVTKDGDGTGTRVTWSGSNSVTITNGQTEVISDAILPAAFGFGASIPRGTKFYVGYRSEVTTVGNSWPSGDGGHGGTEGGFQAFSYNPLNTGITNLQGSGQMFADGATDIASTNDTLCPPVMMIGKFTSATVGVFCAVGDSITYALNDGGGAYAAGRGWFTRSLFDNATTLTNARAGLKLAKSGGLASVWAAGSANGAQAKLVGLTKYASRFIERYGINSINSAGNQANADQLRADKKVIWDAIRAGASGSIIVACVPLTPKTTGTFTTVGGQTPVSGLGEQIGLLDADMTSLAGTGGQHDVYIENTTNVRGNTSKASADYWRWAASASDDGTHPIAATHETMAGAVRTWMQANT